MPTIHLYVVKLKRYGQCGSEPITAIPAPHDHWVAKLVGVLVYNAVEFRFYHC